MTSGLDNGVDWPLHGRFHYFGMDHPSAAELFFQMGTWLRRNQHRSMEGIVVYPSQHGWSAVMLHQQAKLAEVVEPPAEEVA